MVDGIYAIPVPMTTAPKSRKRPGPPSRGGRGILIGLRLQKDDYKAAVDWGKREGVATLPEAIKQLMRLSLAASRSGKNCPSAQGRTRRPPDYLGRIPAWRQNAYGSGL